MNKSRYETSQPASPRERELIRALRHGPKTAQEIAELWNCPILEVRVAFCTYQKRGLFAKDEQRGGLYYLTPQGEEFVKQIREAWL